MPKPRSDLDPAVAVGDLSGDWRVLPLEKVVVESTSGDWGTENRSPGLFPVYAVRGTDFDRAQKGDFSATPIRYLKKPSVERRRVVQGDVLVELSGGSKDQPTGRILLVSDAVVTDLPVTFSNFVRRLRLDTDLVEPAFLAYFWDYLYRNGRTRTYEKRTTGIRNFKLADFLSNEAISLPPLEEQRAIVAVLRAIQQAWASTNKVIRATRDVKRSLMGHLYKYGRVPLPEADEVRLKESEIGLIPEHWELARFADVVEIQSGMVDPRLPEYRTLVHIGPDNIEPETGRLVGGRTAEALGLISGKYLFSDRDVLYSKIRPYLRKAALPDFRGLCSADMYPLRPIDARLSREFLFHYILTDVFSAQAMSFQDRTGIPKINRQQLGLIPVPVAPLEEQAQIAAALSAVDAKSAAEAKRLIAQSTLYESVLVHVMTGRRRLVAEVA